MHFTIPYTDEISDKNGKRIDIFKIFVNGGHFCSARYSAFSELYDRLKLKVTPEELPSFPPKKLLKLSPSQLQERRRGLEDFIQRVSSSSSYNCEDFHAFLKQSQEDTKGIIKDGVGVQIYQMNGDHFDVDIQTTDHTKTVLESLADQINLPRKVANKFGLFLVTIHEDGRISIVRQLQDFEYPYVSLQELKLSSNSRIVVRKTSWNIDLESDIVNDSVGFDILYSQILAEIDLGWILIPDEARQSRLNQLIKRKAKKEILDLVRTLDFYGYIHLYDISICNVPIANTEVLVSTGNFEILFRDPKNEAEIFNKFSLMRIKGWRICTVIDDDCDNGNDRTPRQNFNRPYSATLTFQYLNPSSKVLESIEISNRYTNQIILLSMSLKSMADEYVHHKSAKNLSENHYESFVDSKPKVELSPSSMYTTKMLYTKEIGDDEL